MLSKIQNLDNNYVESEIYINEINYDELDTQQFNKKYKIVEIIQRKKEDESFTNGFLDELVKEERVISVSHNRNEYNSSYILLDKKSDFSLDNFFANYRDDKEYEHREFKILNSYKRDQKEKWKLDVMLNLLLNGMARKNEKASNITGKLHLYVTKEDEAIITLRLNVRGQTLFINQVTFNPATNSKKPKYIIDAGKDNTRLMRKPYTLAAEEKIGKELYEIRSSERTLTLYDKFTIGDMEKNTKTVILHNFMEDFEDQYEDIYKIQFKKYKALSKSVEQQFDTELIKEKLLEIQKLKKVNIVFLGTEEEKEEIREKYQALIEILKNPFREQINTRLNSNQLKAIKKPDKKIELEELKKIEIECVERDMQSLYEPNLIIHHDLKYYEEKKKKDKKWELNHNIPTQSITIETLKGIKISKLGNIAKKILNELVIKMGIFERRLSNWKYGEVEFYLGVKNKNIENEIAHYLLRTKANGEFEILKEAEKIGVHFTQYINSEKYRNRNMMICIVKKDGNYNKIEHTNYIPVVDKDMKKEIESVSKKRRSIKKEYREDKTAYPHIGKTIIEKNGELYYTIGGHNSPDEKVATINNIYKVELLKNEKGENSKFIFEILDMLRSPFVRSDNTESVRPYLFKYLLEFARIENPGVNLYF